MIGANVMDNCVSNIDVLAFERRRDTLPMLNDDLRSVQQQLDDGYLRQVGKTVPASQHPDDLTYRHGRNKAAMCCAKFGFDKCRCFARIDVLFGGKIANEDIGIERDHSKDRKYRVTAAFSIALFISSIETGGPSYFKMPRSCLISPVL